MYCAPDACLSTCQHCLTRHSLPLLRQAGLQCIFWDRWGFQKTCIPVSQIFFFKDLFMYRSTLSACQKRALEPIIAGCEPPCSCWELNLGLLEEQLVLLTEPSLQPIFLKDFLNQFLRVYLQERLSFWTRWLANTSNVAKLPLSITADFILG